MSKEWLEFLGGLLAFLAVVIPIVRNLWRTIRRKVNPREIGMICLAVTVSVAFSLGLIGLIQQWNHALTTFLFMFCILGEAGLFSFNRARISRSDIAGFVISLVLTAMFAFYEFIELQAQLRCVEASIQASVEAAILEHDADKRKSASPRPSASVAPSN